MIKNEYPPNIAEIRKFFTLKKGIVFSYYPDIYAPDSNILNLALFAHEMIHLAQQKEYGVEKWWDRYLRDNAFRLSQEIFAHQVQAIEAKKYIKDRNQYARYIYELASNLSSNIYGRIISFSDALRVIKSGKNYNFRV